MKYKARRGQAGARRCLAGLGLAWPGKARQGLEFLTIKKTIDSERKKMFAKDCLYNKIKDVVSIALSIDLPDNRRIWVPPKGRPFWASCNNNREVTYHRASPVAFERKPQVTSSTTEEKCC
jgi:hypothetical protein